MILPSDALGRPLPFWLPVASPAPSRFSSWGFGSFFGRLGVSVARALLHI